MITSRPLSRLLAAALIFAGVSFTVRAADTTILSAPAAPLQPAWVAEGPGGFRATVDAATKALAFDLAANDPIPHSKIAYRFPLADVRGKTVRATGRFKAEGVSNPPKSWNGPKFAFRVASNGAPVNFPAVRIPAGTYDWKEFSVTTVVPADATNLHLIAGLENVTGKLWIADLTVTVVNTDSPAAAAPTPVAAAAATPAPSTAAAVFTDTFASPAALTEWSPRIGVITQDGPPENPGALKITATTSEGSTMTRRKIPVAEFAGRTVKVSARIKTAGLSTPPKSYNGVKVQLNILDAAGSRNYPQAKLPFVAEQPWTEIGFTHTIPASTTDLELRVGLERITGSLWITDIKIATVP